MKVINVLRHQHRIHFTFLQTVLLKLGNRHVARIDMLVLSKFDEIIVPLPNSHRIVVEEGAGEDLGRVSLSSIPLGLSPVAIVASEGGNAAGCTDTRPCQDSDVFAPNELLSSPRRCLLLWLMLVLFRVLKDGTEARANLVHHVFANVVHDALEPGVVPVKF